VTIQTKSLWDCPASNTFASSEQQFEDVLSCNISQSGSVKWVFTWGNDKTKTSTAELSGNLVEDHGNEIIELRGIIEEGLYQGETVTITVIDTNPAGDEENDCSSPKGRTNAGGSSTLTITHNS
jgi:hypothetical protein